MSTTITPIYTISQDGHEYSLAECGDSWGARLSLRLVVDGELQSSWLLTARDCNHGQRNFRGKPYEPAYHYSAIAPNGRSSSSSGSPGPIPYKSILDWVAYLVKEDPELLIQIKRS